MKCRKIEMYYVEESIQAQEENYSRPSYTSKYCCTLVLERIDIHVHVMIID